MEEQLNLNVQVKKALLIMLLKLSQFILIKCQVTLPLRDLELHWGTSQKSLTILEFLNYKFIEWQNPVPGSASTWKAIAAKRFCQMEGSYFIWKWYMHNKQTFG